MKGYPTQSGYMGYIPGIGYMSFVTETDYKEYYNGVTYCSTHGDYQGCQLIFEKGEIKAVIDFSSASCLPVTWEIMRSFVQSSNYCRTTATVDIKAFCEYVREYQKFSPLTKTDMIAMPYVYLLSDSFRDATIKCGALRILSLF